MATALTSSTWFILTSNAPAHSRGRSCRNRKTRISAQGEKPFALPSFGITPKKQEQNDSGDSMEGSLKSSLSQWGDKLSGDIKALIPASAAGAGIQRRKDPGSVFVAGATGQAGVRIAQSLLRRGFTVRAGVSDLGVAQDLARIASKYKIISPEQSKRLFAVESTYQEAESIAKAIGNASKVVVTIGATENGPTTAVTTTDAFQVIQASQLAGVTHVVIIQDNSYPSTYNNVLGDISSFFTNIFAPKSQPLTLEEFLQKLVETDVNYTLIRTNLTHDFSDESSYNLVVSPEESSIANDFKVSKSQIASLVVDVLSNIAVAENKVIQVSTDPSAPSKPLEQFLSAIPEDGRRKAYAEALARAQAEEDAIKASERAREAAEVAKKLEKEVKKLSEQEARASSLAEEAQRKAREAGTSVENLLNKAKVIGTGFSWNRLSSQIAAAVQKPDDEEPKVRIATVRGEAKARRLLPKKAVIKQTVPKSAPRLKSEPTQPKMETRNLFGGLFKQETIYIDDD